MKNQEVSLQEETTHSEAKDNQSSITSINNTRYSNSDFNYENLSNPGHLDRTKNYMIKSIMSKSLHLSKTTITTSTLVLASILTKELKQFKIHCAQGLPDDLQILRSLAWKINLGLLSIDSDNWQETLKQKRQEYINFKQIIILKLKKEKEQYEKIKDDKEALDIFYQTSNKKLLEDIERDVNRTQNAFSFFFQPTDKTIQFSTDELKLLMEKRRNCSLKNIDDTYKVDIIETHADVIARILFFYSKFSPDVSYNQGMNEIIAPIYYCYSYDKLYEEESELDIEADTFWSFYYLMNEIKHVFIRDEDNNPDGIAIKAAKLERMVKIIDPLLCNHLAEINVQYSYFAYRWFILLFSQDFNLVDVMRLWDMFFSTKDKYHYVYYVALAILETHREKLIDADLINVITQLQDFSEIDINNLALLALRIRSQYKKDIDPIIKERIE